MKQSISPAVMAVVVVIAVGVIGFFGWKMFMSGPAKGGPKPEQAQDARKFRDQYQNYGQNRPRMPGNMSTPGGMGSGGR